MARVLRHWIAEPSVCAYLPDRDAALEYRLMLDVSPADMEYLLERGWRRFGPAYFRPACADCCECVSLRIPVAKLRLSKQQRRVWKQCRDLRLVVGPPVVDEQRLALYHRWHQMQGGARGWPLDDLDAEEYYHQFAFPHPSVREYAYYDEAADGEEPRLVCVGIVDETPNAVSAVYSFYEPDYKKQSLGTANVLSIAGRARATHKKWLYLGYRVMGCLSSEYKGRFQPHELLRGLPELHEEPIWEPVDGRWAGAASSDNIGLASDPR